VVRTVTQQGSTQTVQVTTTAPAATPPPTASSPPPSPPADESGASLNNRGFALMQQGNYATALPLLERSVSALDGTGSLNEAYADYNLAYTRLQLGSCDGVEDLLRESQSIQGHRHEIDDARKQAKKQCH
jgi:tetratricopeptide (TPR) repeat protein